MEPRYRSVLEVAREEVSFHNENAETVDLAMAEALVYIEKLETRIKELEKRIDKVIVERNRLLKAMKGICAPEVVQDILDVARQVSGE